MAKWPGRPDLLEELDAREAVLLPARFAVLLQRRARGLGGGGARLDVGDGGQHGVNGRVSGGLAEEGGR